MWETVSGDSKQRRRCKFLLEGVFRLGERVPSGGTSRQEVGIGGRMRVYGLHSQKNLSIHALLVLGKRCCL